MQPQPIRIDKIIAKTFAALSFACALSQTAHAQLGSGWTPASIPGYVMADLVVDGICNFSVN